MVFYYVKDKIRTLVYAMSSMICLLVPHRLTFFFILIDSIPNYLQLLKCNTLSLVCFIHIYYFLCMEYSLSSTINFNIWLSTQGIIFSTKHSLIFMLKVRFLHKGSLKGVEVEQSVLCLSDVCSSLVPELLLTVLLFKFCIPFDGISDVSILLVAVH